MLEGVPFSARPASGRHWFTSHGNRIMLLCFQGQILSYSVEGFSMSPGREGSECDAVPRALPMCLMCKVFKRNSRMKTSHSPKVLVVLWRQASQNSQSQRSISFSSLSHYVLLLTFYRLGSDLPYHDLLDLVFDSGLDKNMSHVISRKTKITCLQSLCNEYWAHLINVLSFYEAFIKVRYK